MDHVERWPELWKDHSMAGAALGTALNVGDPTLMPRWLLMFGLALGTTAVWVLVDAFFLAGKTTDEAYRQWALGFARNLYTYGMIWAAVAGTWYVFRTWEPDLRDKMFAWPLVVLTVVTAVAPGLPWALMMTANWRSSAGGRRRFRGQTLPSWMTTTRNLLRPRPSCGAVLLWPQLRCVSSACSASTPPAVRSCKTST